VKKKTFCTRAHTGGGGKGTVPPLEPVKGGVRALRLLNLRLKSEKHKKIVSLEGGIKQYLQGNWPDI